MTSDLFSAHFEYAPAITAQAHGRVNLIGDHTDYNGGLVMPCLLNQTTEIALALREDDRIRGISDGFGPMEGVRGAQVDGSWMDFVQGAIAMLEPYHEWRGGVDVAVHSTVPAGAGVSSSAALEIALLRGLCAALGITDIDPVRMAQLAQRIEHEFVGTKCGIMDQMVSSAATPGAAMMLDCATLDYQLSNLFPAASFVVMHSGSSRKLSDGLYNTRLGECQAAASMLGLSLLCEADIDNLVALDDPLLRRRARHVVSETARVRAATIALRDDDMVGFGGLMLESHNSLRDDYEVSSAELDALVNAFLDAGALGARLTGAGFGGCVVALCMNDAVDVIVKAVKNCLPSTYLVDVVAT